MSRSIETGLLIGATAATIGAAEVNASSNVDTEALNALNNSQNSQVVTTVFDRGNSEMDRYLNIEKDGVEQDSDNQFLPEPPRIPVETATAQPRSSETNIRTSPEVGDNVDADPHRGEFTIGGYVERPDGIWFRRVEDGNWVRSDVVNGDYNLDLLPNLDDPSNSILNSMIEKGINTNEVYQIFETLENAGFPENTLALGNFEVHDYSAGNYIFLQNSDVEENPAGSFYVARLYKDEDGNVILDQNGNKQFELGFIPDGYLESAYEQAGLPMGANGLSIERNIQTPQSNLLFRTENNIQINVNLLNALDGLNAQGDEQFNSILQNSTIISGREIQQNESYQIIDSQSRLISGSSVYEIRKLNESSLINAAVYNPELEIDILPNGDILLDRLVYEGEVVINEDSAFYAYDDSSQMAIVGKEFEINNTFLSEVQIYQENSQVSQYKYALLTFVYRESGQYYNFTVRQNIRTMDPSTDRSVVYVEDLLSKVRLGPLDTVLGVYNDGTFPNTEQGINQSCLRAPEDFRTRCVYMSEYHSSYTYFSSADFLNNIKNSSDEILGGIIITNW